MFPERRKTFLLSSSLFFLFAASALFPRMLSGRFEMRGDKEQIPSVSLCFCQSFLMRKREDVPEKGLGRDDGSLTSLQNHRNAQVTHHCWRKWQNLMFDHDSDALHCLQDVLTQVQRDGTVSDFRWTRE
jgi:hypothetical protein